MDASWQILELGWALVGRSGRPLGRLELTEAQKREDPKTNEKRNDIHWFLLLGALRRLLVEPSETVVGGFFGPLEAILGRQRPILSSLGTLLGPCW